MKKGYYKTSKGVISFDGYKMGDTYWVRLIHSNGTKTYWTEETYELEATLMDIDKIYTEMYERFLDNIKRL